VQLSDGLGQQQQGFSALSASAEWLELQQQQAGIASGCRTGEAPSETSGVALASKNAAKLTAEISFRQRFGIVREPRISGSTTNLTYCTFFPTTSNASSKWRAPCVSGEIAHPLPRVGVGGVDAPAKIGLPAQRIAEYHLPVARVLGYFQGGILRC
jgi:hypothetical protein